ncbi:NUDIX hydrolase [Piscinibacter sp. XHJ-5]|uniref:NUDIX hydrolase n=1 Tax=Piscinibacter sp. XHJ-5 TaxID=3037797 RepID=UPI002452B093|nr:NUDIX hydrolase [Piscinibacter sp. XHJ-5]
MNEIETLETRLVYKNRWMSVREDQIRRQDGSVGTYGVVEKKDFAVIAAVQDGRLVLVEQYRYPVRGRFWELPQGTWDSEQDHSDELAMAELREETGLVARSMVQVGHLYLAYGFCTQGYTIFLATDLEQREPQLEPEEQGLVSSWFDLSAVEQMIRNGTIVDASTVAAMSLIKAKGLL